MNTNHARKTASLSECGNTDRSSTSDGGAVESGDGMSGRHWPIADRLIIKTRKAANGCILWLASKDSCGYGRMGIGQKVESAHRIAYGLFVGPIPDDLHVLHKCDTPCCINPLHLFLGTPKDNSEDKVKKQRQYKPRPEETPAVKVNGYQVLEIRRLYRSGMIQSEICKLFGINQQSVSNIVTRKTWKHIPEQEQPL